MKHSRVVTLAQRLRADATAAAAGIVTTPSTGQNNNQFYYVGAQYTF
jgi:hypothetical protein